tara:strand:+ start:156 stop:260 length:105 start_codon:yes stop_codon:yes gene_type:complete
MTEVLRRKVQELGAYHLLISDKRAGTAVDEMKRV